jgi:hypothetical protein
MLGYMAGWNFSHWAKEILFGFSSGGSKSNGQYIFT